MTSIQRGAMPDSCFDVSRNVAAAGHARNNSTAIVSRKTPKDRLANLEIGIDWDVYIGWSINFWQDTERPARRNPRRRASKTFRRRLRVVRVYEWYEYGRSGISAVFVSRGVIFVPHATRCSERRGLGVVVAAGTRLVLQSILVHERRISPDQRFFLFLLRAKTTYINFITPPFYSSRFHHFSNLS